jgi:PAS domain S-box-containing protein
VISREIYLDTGDTFRAKIYQLLAIAWLLFWYSTSYAKTLPISTAPSPLSYLYWFLALLLCMFAGYFMGSRRRIDEENYQAAIEKTLSANELRLRQQQAALAVLTKEQLKDWQNPEEVFREIAKISAETLNVERVSIWLFSDDNQQLECMDLYLKSKNLHTIAKPLQATELPVYFKFISQHRVIAANDVMHHPSTVELLHGYVQENGVGAMLDGTIWLNNNVIGVICHEHVGSSREWMLDEQSFVGSVADLVRLTIETDKRRKAETDLLKHKKSLEAVIEKRTAAIENNVKLFQFLVERAPVIILYMNDANEIIEMNPEAERVSGYSREFAIGKTYEELFSSPETKLYNQMLVQKLSRGELKFQGENLLVRCADGSHVELSVSRSSELDTDGNKVIISIGQDMSKQKALESSLIKAREAAESADRIKSMFVASMSHELRTPLNSIIGFLGVVLQGMSGELNIRQKDQLGRAYNSSKHLLSLISDVIDISKIEAGFLQVYVEKFDLIALLTEVQHAVQHLAEEKELALIIDCPPEIKLETDRKRLYQVVLNVVSNGLKYSEQGAVKVTASIKAKKLLIVVEDTGIGISEENLVDLFKPFVRVDSHLKIKTLGTGLGLYLTRKILSQLLCGEISVTSQLGLGSLFTVSLPIKIPKVTMQNQTSVLEDLLP